jgi:signal peptidase I
MTTSESRPDHRRRSKLWIHLALALGLTAVVIAFLGQPSSGSMSPTLEPGDRLIVNRLAYVGSDPAAGDIVLFRPGDAWGERPTPANGLSAAVSWVGETTGIRPYVLVKRVIGVPGDTVECCSAEGAVRVNGVELDEPYVRKDLPFIDGELDCDSQPASLRCFPPVTVPAESYLVLGDNRANSADSAYLCRGGGADDCWRWAERDLVVGEAGPILWPISRWGGP